MAKLDVSAVISVGLGNDPVLQFAVHKQDGSPVTNLTQKEVVIALVATTAWGGWNELNLYSNLVAEVHPGVYHASPAPPSPWSDWGSSPLLDAVFGVEVTRKPDRGFSYACACAYDPAEGHFWSSPKGTKARRSLKFNPRELATKIKG
jgi:hypothetical protein